MSSYLKHFSQDVQQGVRGGECLASCLYLTSVASFRYSGVIYIEKEETERIVDCWCITNEIPTSVLAEIPNSKLI